MPKLTHYPGSDCGSAQEVTASGPAQPPGAIRRPPCYTVGMAKKPTKIPVPKHNKLMRLMEHSDSAPKGRFQEAWEEMRRRSQATQRERPADRKGD